MALDCALCNTVDISQELEDLVKFIKKDGGEEERLWDSTHKKGNKHITMDRDKIDPVIRLWEGDVETRGEDIDKHMNSHPGTFFGRKQNNCRMKSWKMERESPA
eukprot:15335441-Heterocapsa_arctica.AAC.1